MVQVNYVGIPADLGWVEPIPDTWTIKVSSYGFGLLGKKYFSNDDPVVVDLSRLSKEGKVEIQTLDFASSVARQLGSDNQILEILPKTINSELSMNRTKVVPVHLSILSDLPAGYFVSTEQHCTPDSVLVSGPMLLLDTLRWVVAKPITINLSNSKDSLVADLVTQDGIEINVNTVTVLVITDEYTEGSLMVPIENIQASDSLWIRTIPDSTLITFQVGLNDYESLSYTDFIVEPEIPGNVSLESLYKLRLRLKMSPEIVQKVQLSPARVEFLLEKRSD